jgi:hypothetical protein
MNSHPETLAMTFPFPIPQADPAPEPAGPTGAPSDPAGCEASRLTVPPQIGSRPAGFRAAPDTAAPAPAAPAADPRIPVAVPRPDAGDAENRINPAAGAADAASRPHGVLWRAAALGIAACLGAAAGSAGSAAIHLFGPPARTQADPLDDLRTLKESVAQLRGHVKVVNDNMTALRANFGTVTSALTSQLSKISDEVEKVERLQSDRRAGTSESAAPAPGEAKPSKPAVVEGWVLRSVSDGVALIEGRHGIIEIEPGDSLPGIGRIHEIKRQDGHWVVVTPKGLIVSAR